MGVTIKYDYRDIRWHPWEPGREKDMKTGAMFPGSYLKAGDLQGKAHILTIDSLVEEEIGEPKESKWVLKFVGKERGLVLNKTNTNAIADLHGDETDNWKGKEVVLYPTKTEFAGKSVDCIRVKLPEPVVEVAEEPVPF
jgi:hypothetical protein